MTDLSSGILDRRQVLEALRASEERYRTLFESIDEGFCTIEVLFDGNGKAYDYRFLEMNPAFERHTGLANAAGRTVRELAPDHEEFWFEIYGGIARGGRPIRFEHEAAALGKIYDVYAFRTGEPGENRVAVLFSDIFDRKRAEAALRESEERQKFLLSLADTLRPLADALAVQDQATRMLGEHLRVAHVYYYEINADDELQVGRGFSADGATWPERMRLSDYGDLVVNAFRRGETVAVDDVEHDPLLNEAIRAAFRAIGAQASVGVPLVKNGRLAGSLGVHQPTPRRWTLPELQLIEEVAERTWEAVERAHAEAALREREEKYRSLFDAIDEGFNLIEVIFDEARRPVDCRILEINPAYHRNTGLPASVVGRLLSEFIPGGFEQRILDIYGRVALTGEPLRFEEYVSGLERWFDCYAFRVGGEGSRRVAVVFNNVTEKKRAADQLREADRRKSEFLAMLGHELRNPLAAVEGGLKLLQSPKAREESRAATLPIVAQQVAHMKRLIDDVLDLARLDRGKLQVQRIAVDLHETLAASIRMTENLAQAKGSQIRYAPSGQPILLHADPERLMQVFANLLINALKFSPNGAAVDVVVTLQEQRALVEVRDYGQGIAPEYLAEIFEPFVQSKLSLGIPEAGLGLGLSVSRELVELHGGAITAQSAGANQGSTFTVALPRPAAGARMAEV